MKKEFNFSILPSMVQSFGANAAIVFSYMQLLAAFKEEKNSEWLIFNKLKFFEIFEISRGQQESAILHLHEMDMIDIQNDPANVYEDTFLFTMLTKK